VAEGDEAAIDEGQDEPQPDDPSAPRAWRRRPRVSECDNRASGRELDPRTCCLTVAAICRRGGWRCQRTAGHELQPRWKVVQIARIKKSCRRLRADGAGPAPSRPSQGSMAGRTCLPHILVAKVTIIFLISAARDLRRMGADIPETTLVGLGGGRGHERPCRSLMNG